MNIEIPDNVRNIRLAITGRHVTVSFDIEDGEGLLKEVVGHRPNLQIPEVQEAMTRWLTM